MIAPHFPAEPLLPFSEHTRHRLLIAAVVVSIGATPTVLDALLVWRQEPAYRPLIILAWALALFVAWNAWQLFDKETPTEEYDGDTD